jgi:hypothetical protein
MSDQPNTSNKLVAGGTAGAAAVIILAWGVKQFTNIEIPDYVQNAIGIIISLTAAHLTPVNAPPPPKD